MGAARARFAEWCVFVVSLFSKSALPPVVAIASYEVTQDDRLGTLIMTELEHDAKRAKTEPQLVQISASKVFFFFFFSCCLPLLVWLPTHFKKKKN